MKISKFVYFFVLKIRIKKLLGVLFLCIMILSGHSISTAKQNKSAQTAPGQVIKNFFNYYNVKDRTKFLSTLTPWHSKRNVDFSFNSIENIKLISAEEESDLVINRAYSISHNN